MFSAQTNTTVVGRLRIRSKSSDPQAEQQRLTRMLRSASLHPAGLSESAMLVVRRLADPLPSRLRAGPFDTLPDPSWQRAVAASLQELASSAARPAYGPVPAESNAVLFYDRAEILASLALDWMSGALASQWWWRELLRGHDAITALLREWIETPQYVPGALELLAQRQRIVQFVQRLPEPAAAEMLQAIIRIYGVPRPQEALPQINSSDSKEHVELGAVMPARTKTRHHSPARPVPWLQWTPEASTPGLSTPQKMLLIQALMLRRAPATVRTMSFQKALLQWQATAERSEDNQSLSAQAHQPENQRAAQSLNSWSPSGQPSLEIFEETAGRAESGGNLKPAGAPVSHPAGQQPHESVTFAKPLLPTANKAHGKNASPEMFARRVAAQDMADKSAGITNAVQPQPKGGQETTVTPESAIAHSSQRKLVEPQALAPKASIESSTTLETEYGGVFFLLSLALYLDIYSDFTRPAETGLELNIWDFLALMASEFTGGNVENDPLWTQLAALAGRTPSERPGLKWFHSCCSPKPVEERPFHGFCSLKPVEERPLVEERPFRAVFRNTNIQGFSPGVKTPTVYARSENAVAFDSPNEWQMPLHPLEPFPEDYDRNPKLINGRMVVTHPAGFTVLDMPACENSASEPADCLQRWVIWMASYLRARLVRALGREDAAEFLCHLRAQVSLTLTHLDVNFSLDHHPIEVRMAGLDRNLGWIPAAGRYVAFHFD